MAINNKYFHTDNSHSMQAGIPCLLNLCFGSLFQFFACQLQEPVGKHPVPGSRFIQCITHIEKDDFFIPENIQHAFPPERSLRFSCHLQIKGIKNRDGATVPVDRIFDNIEEALPNAFFDGDMIGVCTDQFSVFSR